MADGDLRNIFSDNIPRLHWTPVETGGTRIGVPDSNYCADGVEGWVENKKTDAWAVTVQPGQVAWIEKRLRAGGRVFIAVRRKSDGGPRKGGAKDQLWMLRGQAIRSLAVAPLSALPAALLVQRWDNGPRNWDWPAIAKILLG